MEHQPHQVELCQEKVVIPTYGCGKPDRNPMFLEKRVYQGSGGKVYYLGCLRYDRRQYESAIVMWERSADLDPSFPTVWRNLSPAYYKKSGDRERALACMQCTYALDQSDARVLLELDQLWHKSNVPMPERFALLHAHRDVASPGQTRRKMRIYD